jgi:hypothetical protein
LVGHACADAVFDAAIKTIAQAAANAAVRNCRDIANEVVISLLPRFVDSLSQTQGFFEDKRRLAARQCALMRLWRCAAREGTLLLGRNGLLPGAGKSGRNFLLHPADELLADLAAQIEGVARRAGARDGAQLQ